jgi:hypothetical protein
MINSNGPQRSIPTPALQRPSPEIERRLKKIEEGVSHAKSPISNDGRPGWVPTTEVLYIAYAVGILNLTAGGTIVNQTDCTGFTFVPFNDSGVLHAFRGRLVTTSVYASGDPTDYIWEETGDLDMITSFERYYTTSSSLLSLIGDPDNAGLNIIWTKHFDSATDTGTIGALSNTAFWVADRFTVEEVRSVWKIYPVKTGTTDNLGLIAYEKLSTAKPTLNDSNWKAHVLQAASAFTGSTYSVHTELGLGAVVSIKYADGKLIGILRNVAQFDDNGATEGHLETWEAPTSVVDGSLVVDGSITTDQISARTIRAENIAAGVITSNEVTLAPKDVGAGDALIGTCRINASVHPTINTEGPCDVLGGVFLDGQCLIGGSIDVTINTKEACNEAPGFFKNDEQAKLVINSKSVKVYDSTGTLRVTLGELD